MNIKILKLEHASDLPLPAHATPGSAGLDLMSASDAEITIHPGSRGLIPTGLSIYLPLGYEAQVRPRSGLALKHGVTVLNSPGTIDSDYTGEVKVILINLGTQDFIVSKGMRIAQLVVAPYTPVQWDELQEEPSVKPLRGLGFGSTGI
jgi:dUTP pyrophosphatase